MGIYKRGKYYWVKFQVDGRIIRVSTECRSRKAALKVEAHMRDQIAMGNWGVIERRGSPVLSAFLPEFVEWVESNYENKNTRANYLLGARQLAKSVFIDVKLDAITSEHTSKYVRANRHMTPAGINQALRTLQRLLSLAQEWGRIERKPHIKLLKENKRDRVLTYDEEDRYLESCPEPWKAIAIIMLDCGLRPEEGYELTWANIDFERKTLQVASGKTDAARRTLTMSDRVIDALRPMAKEPGHVFPGRRQGSHVSQSKLWNQHEDALLESEVDPFAPYTLRHTCLTRMGEYVPLPTLKVIAGHTSILMTQRYVHPAQRSVDAAFEEAGARHKNRHRAKFRVVRNGGEGQK